MSESRSGIGVSAGIAIGRAVLHRESTSDYEKKSKLTSEQEQERLERALLCFEEASSAAAADLRTKVSAYDAAILEGHTLMLHDPCLRGEIDDMIAKGATAEYATAAVLESYIIVFTASDDELVRQRAADVRDIKTSLLDTLLEKRDTALTLSEDAILVTEELTPSLLAKLAASPPAGILTAKGSVTSHAAILAGTLGIPAVFALEGGIRDIVENAAIILDGSTGEVTLNPEEAVLREAETKVKAQREARKALRSFADKPTCSSDGVRFHLWCNIGVPAEAGFVRANGGEGIGLMRSEFLFMDRAALPDEEEQYEAYKSVAEALEGKPLIIRTLDIGGDKSIPYLGIEREDNPFLGFRAIRYCLAHEEIFKAQFRAILRASSGCDLRIMLPFITGREEIHAAKKLLEACGEELNLPTIPLGIMIETPAAVLTAEILAREVDFFSIGTNDLTQYILTADRGNPAAAPYYDPFHPAVLRAVAHTIKSAKKAGISVGMCGESASDPKMIPLLMAMGLDEFSVSPAKVIACRAEIAKWSISDAKAHLDRVMAAESVREVHSLLQI